MNLIADCEFHAWVFVLSSNLSESHSHKPSCEQPPPKGNKLLKLTKAGKA